MGNTIIKRSISLGTLKNKDETIEELRTYYKSLLGGDVKDDLRKLIPRLSRSDSTFRGFAIISSVDDNQTIFIGQNEKELYLFSTSNFEVVSSSFFDTLPESKGVGRFDLFQGLSVLIFFATKIKVIGDINNTNYGYVNLYDITDSFFNYIKRIKRFPNSSNDYEMYSEGYKKYKDVFTDIKRGMPKGIPIRL